MSGKCCNFEESIQGPPAWLPSQTIPKIRANLWLQRSFLAEAQSTRACALVSPSLSRGSSSPPCKAGREGHCGWATRAAAQTGCESCMCRRCRAPLEEWQTACCLAAGSAVGGALSQGATGGSSAASTIWPHNLHLKLAWIFVQLSLIASAIVALA